MSITELGAIGELVAAIATVITLIYLAIQLRQNTKVLRLTQSRAIESDAQNARGRFVENKDVAELYITGLTSPEALDQADRLRFRMLLEQLFFDWQLQIELFSESHSAADHFIEKTLETSGGRTYWEKVPKQIFQPEFVKHVDHIFDRVSAG